MAQRYRTLAVPVVALALISASPSKASRQANPLFRHTTDIELNELYPSSPNNSGEEGYSENERNRIENALGGICGDIYLKTLDPRDPEHYAFKYQSRIYDAAGVNFSEDTPKSARKKIQDLFVKHRDLLECNATNFQLSRGSIVEYGIDIMSYSIVHDAVLWKLDLNYIGNSKGNDQRIKTLDFIEKKLNQNRGNPIFQRLFPLYPLVRKSGAKHCHELSDNCETIDYNAVFEGSAFIDEFEFEFIRFKNMNPASIGDFSILAKYYLRLRSRGARHCYELQTPSSCKIKGNDTQHSDFLRYGNGVAQ